MQLIEALRNRDQLPEDTFICVRRPWKRESEILLVPCPDDLRVPSEVLAAGFEYFLEVDVVREILEGFLPCNPTHEQVADFVLYYAEFDAFPDWANELCQTDSP